MHVLVLSRHQNLIAQSQSGTGKTAAFSLAMLGHVNPDNTWTQVSRTPSEHLTPPVPGVFNED